MFLLEGGRATEKWGTQRATQRDIQVVARFFASALNVPENEVMENLLGSTNMTMMGYAEDSGDVDIALNTSKHKMEATHKKILKRVNEEGVLSPRIRVGSYAVPVGNDKKVQADLMFFDNMKWAKFMYLNEQGRSSKYKGVVRNVLLVSMIRHMTKPGDIVIKDQYDNTVARAKYSLDINSGIKRTYKVIPTLEYGAKPATLQAVSAAEFQNQINAMGPQYAAATIDTRDSVIDDPDEAMQFVFGDDVTAADVVTPEQTLALLKKSSTIPDQLKSIIAKDAVLTLRKLDVKYPPGLDKLAT